MHPPNTIIDRLLILGIRNTLSNDIEPQPQSTSATRTLTTVNQDEVGHPRENSHFELHRLQDLENRVES